ncbi:MAG: hypothetical protein ACD_76C00043G0003 [uncultured bacterium]|nr:MAG: hypothetical protein ACD_76C00043G0003 [uncultured bacterium]
MRKQRSVKQYKIGAVCRFPSQTGTPDEGKKIFSLNDITWRIFRIMAEFVEGFELLSTTKKEISIYGSTRAKQGSPPYEEARKLGRLLGKAGYTVITGGGPGIMEAGNRGAYEAGAESIGLNIQLPKEQRTNPYITKSHGFHYFFSRKVMLAASAQAYVFCHGGVGTLDEFLEILTLIQTKKMQRVPVICLGKEFWLPIVDGIFKKHLYDKYKTISPEDLALITVVDSAQEAFAIIRRTKERTIF